MSTTAPLDLAYETPPDIKTYKLTRLDLYNWGGFEGRHGVDIDPRGTAIIGPTGAGKTTLVDALMTLLTEHPKYNLASTGGHESDRDLVSYVRGVSGAGTSDGSNAHIARSGKTLTGIAATFSDNNEPLTIGALFWIDGTSSGASDLGRLWIFSRVPEGGLDTWLEAHHEGGSRRLKQLKNDTAGLELWDSKKAYLARLRDFFEVGENAFTLLNRAAGLKQLNSIDEIFRELVLDDKSAFERAAQVVREFDDLQAIHAELELARRQVNALMPLRMLAAQRSTLQESIETSASIKSLLPTWFAEHAHRQWTLRCDALTKDVEKLTLEETSTAAELKKATQEADDLRAIYLKAGGSDVESLRNHIAGERHRSESASRHAEQYQRLIRRLGLDEAISLTAFKANQEQLPFLRDRLINDRQQHQEAQEAIAGRAHLLRQQRDQYLDEIRESSARPNSNIPPKYHNFRVKLAEHLNLNEGDVPFVAELIQVKPTENAWRGAIERAIGGHRLRVLVPSNRLKEALRWVNKRDNQMHVRLLEVVTPVGTARFKDDGYTRKLDFANHPYRETVKHLLAENDRHCVASSDDLQNLPFAMTVEGLMSGQRGFFDKLDQVPLSQDWCTGFDNKDRLVQLQDALSATEKDLKEIQDALRGSRNQLEEIAQKLGLLDQLATLQFQDIDLESANTRVRELEDRLARLTDPSSDSGKAHAAWQDADRNAKGIQDSLREIQVSLRTEANALQQAQDDRERAHKRVGIGLDAEQRQRLVGHEPNLDGVSLSDLPDIERSCMNDLETKISKLRTDLSACERRIVSDMGAAKREDRGSLAEAGTDLGDLPAYLDRLRILEQEDLPAKQQRFQDYLNQSSDQGVTQLLSDIENEVSIIEERIDDLNNTLRRVDFSVGHFLRLDPKRIRHASLDDLQLALKNLRSARFKEDNGESHYKALQQVVSLLRDAAERKRVSGSLAMLDPRYRLSFSVSVIDRDSRAIIETRTDSKGGSGGEKEIIASHVLTASLSYALCPPGSSRPLFGTVVLDEAFSRSSHTVAGRIISALSEFGLHPLFVTPNKELRLLRSHTRSAILVHRRGACSGMTSITWEELDKHVVARQEATPT